CDVHTRFYSFFQITFSKDWRPSGKRSLSPLLSDDYNSHLKSALGYTKLAEIHLQSLMTFPRHPERNPLFKSEGGLDDIIMPYFAPPEEDKIH
ncbi:hypothetical protein WDU94_013726, partial [Cyamophila willieti]